MDCLTMIKMAIGFDSDQYGGMDCNDANELINPNAADNTPDNIDNNCDGQIDEGVGGIDNDGDGFTNLDGDCDDTRSSN